MMRVFVYEHVSASGAVDADPELLEAGLAMRDAVVRDLLATGDCAVSVASPGDVPAHEIVARAAGRHDGVWVIAPETRGVLSALRRVVPAPRWLGCSADAIALTSSKRATLHHAAAHGLRTPLEFATTGRWVVKPDDGAGALATTVHDGPAPARADAEARRARGEPVALEPWVDGEPMSLSLLCRHGAAELLAVNRQRIGIDAGGTLSFIGVDIDVLPPGDTRRDMLQAWSRSLVRTLPGLRGYVGVDLVWHPERGPVLIEINPRVTMAYVGLSAALGRNLAAEVLASLPARNPAHADTA